MLTIMQGFYKWAHYLKGNDAIMEVLMDHQNLTYFWKPQNLNWWQAQWITLDLQEYTFTIKHQSGKSNTKADLLSWRANYPGGENDNKDDILLKEELFQNIEMQLDEVSYHWLLLWQEIANTHQRYFNKQVQKGIKDKNPNFVKYPLNRIWEWKGWIYVPAKKELRDKII